MLNENEYINIINEFTNNFSKKDYIINYTPFKSMFTLTGKRDARKKYFTIKIAIRSFRKYSTSINCKIMSETYKNCYNVMIVAEKMYNDIIFTSADISYDGIMIIKFTAASECALTQLASRTISNY